MKILLDMNLSPKWKLLLEKENWEVLHWTEVGLHNALDREIFDWAKANDFIVFTNDLDFGTILAVTNADAPSVIQIKTQDVMPHIIGERVIKTIKEYRGLLLDGVLLTIDDLKDRIRILPIHK